MSNDTLTQADARIIGNVVIGLLQLRPLARKVNDPVPLNDPRYPTTWGNKTAEGLGRTIARIVDDPIEAAKLLHGG